MLCKKFRGERKSALCYFLANNLTSEEIVLFILSIVISTLLPLCLRKLSFTKWVLWCNSRRLLDVKEHWSLSWHLISNILHDTRHFFWECCNNIMKSSGHKLKFYYRPNEFLTASITYIYHPSCPVYLIPSSLLFPIPCITSSPQVEHTDGERTLARVVGSGHAQRAFHWLSQKGIALLTSLLMSTGAPSILKYRLARLNSTPFQMATQFFPVSVAQQPQKREAGQHTT
jgi:hypothetical protein